jgi:glycosyltransferase involved in cell wall biosynthesis
MRIGILIPDRNDRPEFLENCLRMMNNQTLQPVEIEIVNDPPKNADIDITWRYRTGYERLCKKNIDLICFIENDDWYHPEYLETMLEGYRNHSFPILLGLTYTIYYHLRLKKYFFFNHSNRSSAMSTCIRPNLPNINWGVDNDPYTDLVLWQFLGKEMGDRIVFKPEKHICIGLKHGVGKTGGYFHNNELERYEFEDNGFLESIIAPVDPEGWKFYQNLQLQ